MKGYMIPYQGVAGIVLSLKKLPITIIINVLDEMKSHLVYITITFFLKRLPGGKVYGSFLWYEWGYSFHSETFSEFSLKRNEETAIIGAQI